MISDAFRQQTIDYCKSLMNSFGFASEYDGAEPGIQATLSVCKILDYLGASKFVPDKIVAAVKNQYDASEGVFCDETDRSIVFASAAALLLLNYADAQTELKAFQGVLAHMDRMAKIREEHFMVLAVKDECHFNEVDVPRSIEFFRSMEVDGSFGPEVLNNAIAASALLRIGEKLSKPEKVKSLLLSAQKKDGGFGEPGKSSDLWISYCVSRALVLLSVQPDDDRLAKWILSMASSNGGFAVNGQVSAGTTYQALNILHNISDPVVNWVNINDFKAIKDWLNRGGDPEIATLTGWTPLMVASVRGYSEIVKYLLQENRPGKKVDPNRKLTSADALPLFWAGQSGDLETVKALLKMNPKHLYSVSKVNGHNVLLQAAFFGSEKHYQVVQYILENIGEILGINPVDQDAIIEVRNRLTCSCNVRGYTGFTMSQLWGNKKIGELFKQFDNSTVTEKIEYYQDLLKAIEEPLPAQEPQKSEALLANQLAQTIADCFTRLERASNKDQEHFHNEKEECFCQIQDIVRNPKFNINARGGQLMETPVIIAVTGVDKNSDVAAFRKELLHYFLENGADPNIPEKHPMAVDAVIRSAVLNHFDLLQMIADYMPPLAFAAALNELPVINGQTALQDTVHRSLTANGDALESHLQQIRWCVQRGAKTNLEDHTGTSPELLALKALDDPIYKTNAEVVLDALGICVKGNDQQTYKEVSVS